MSGGEDGVGGGCEDVDGSYSGAGCEDVDGSYSGAGMDSSGVQPEGDGEGDGAEDDDGSEATNPDIHDVRCCGICGQGAITKDGGFVRSSTRTRHILPMVPCAICQLLVHQPVGHGRACSTKNKMFQSQTDAKENPICRNCTGVCAHARTRTHTHDTGCNSQRAHVHDLRTHKNTHMHTRTDRQAP